MKQSIFLTLLVVIGTLSACRKDPIDTPTPVSKTSLLTTGTWSLTVMAHDYDGNGSYETDVFANAPTCFRDNFWTFRANGDLELNEGNTKCDPIDPQTDITNWQLTNNENSLVLDGDVFSITELNSSNIKLKEVFQGGSTIVTFTKR